MTHQCYNAYQQPPIKMKNALYFLEARVNQVF